MGRTARRGLALLKRETKKQKELATGDRAWAREVHFHGGPVRMLGTGPLTPPLQASTTGALLAPPLAARYSAEKADTSGALA